MLRVAVVGPCMSGKSELVRALRAQGYPTRHVAQEHSYVPAMWQRMTDPDVLVYLDVSYEAVRARRPTVSWGPERLQEQAGRLGHAREHCDLYVDTSKLSIEAVREKVLAFLRELETEPSS
jgi:hypothetical protein